MKNIFTSVLLLMTVLSFSQKNKRIIYSEDSEIKVIYENNNQKLAEIYVNDTFIGLISKDMSNVIDPNKIDSIKIVKEKLNVQDYAGGIMITSKSYYTPNFITVKELVNKYLKIDDDPIVLQINDNIINQDYNTYKVDEEYILKIIVSKIKTSKDLTINLIKIITKTEKNIEEANKIMIR